MWVPRPDQDAAWPPTLPQAEGFVTTLSRVILVLWFPVPYGTLYSHHREVTKGSITKSLTSIGHLDHVLRRGGGYNGLVCVTPDLIYLYLNTSAMFTCPVTRL